jgi:hypothetical protein
MDIPCKTSGCNAKVTYVPVKVYGLIGKVDKRLERTDPTATKTVYLTCSQGHTNAYEVKADR